MGTFTFSYFGKTVWAKYKFVILLSPAVYYFGNCYYAACGYKREMMKGHSRMYANRIANIPEGQDPWKW